MRYYDEGEAQKLGAEQWQLDLLNLNPAYCSWGPHEDYMWNEGNGWDSRIIAKTWADFGPWELDDLNECVNFYFEVTRSSAGCSTCGGNGYHKDAQHVVNTFYRHQCQPGETHWNDKITEDEAAALVKAGRYPAGSTAASINAANKPGALGLGHDAINRMILVEARLGRLGLPELCTTCNGDGAIYTENHARVALVLWWIHPRKGCSRGIEIERIEQSELPAVYAFLTAAAKRNAERFQRIPGMKEAAQ